MTNNLESTPQLPSVIESPDGEIQYCKPISINKNNPYRNTPLDNSNNTQVECDGNIIYIPTNVIQNAVRLQRKAIFVRLFCLFDFVINIFISFATYYTSFFSIFISIISITGYYSTFTYNKRGLISYLIYQYIQAIYKIVYLIFYILTAYNIRSIYLKNTGIILSFSIENTIILSLYLLSQIYITYFIQQFYNLLPKNSIQNQQSIYLIV